MLADTLNDSNGKQVSARLPKWKIGGSDFGIFAALLFSCMVVVSSIFTRVTAWLTNAEVGPNQPLLVTLAGNLGMQIGMLAAFIGFNAVTKPQSEADAQPNRPSLAKSITTGLKWLLIAYPFMLGVNLLWQLLLESQGFEQVTQDPIRLVQEGGTALERVLIYTMIVIVAPVCEELVFRGAIFRYLHHRLHLVAAIAISAFFFAVIHVNLYSFAPLFVIGVTLALAYRESGSILSPIAFHASFNTINLLLILLFPDLQ